MNCTRIKKWLSDSIDGELPDKIKKKLDAHMQDCQNCSSYKLEIMRIHRTVTSREMSSEIVAISDEYWEDFPSRIKKKISSIEYPDKKFLPFTQGWKWAFVSAALLFVFVFGLFVINFNSGTLQEALVFSFEDSLDQIYQEVENDALLEGIIDLAFFIYIVIN